MGMRLIMKRNNFFYFVFIDNMPTHMTWLAFFQNTNIRNTDKNQFTMSQYVLIFDFIYTTLFRVDRIFISHIKDHTYFL
jgi:hypothetical protein